MEVEGAALQLTGSCLGSMKTPDPGTSDPPLPALYRGGGTSMRPHCYLWGITVASECHRNFGP